MGISHDEKLARIYIEFFDILFEVQKKKQIKITLYVLRKAL